MEYTRWRGYFIFNKISRIAFLFAQVLFLLVASPCDANEVPNPSVEIGDNGSPLGWSSYTWSDSIFVWDNSEYRSGNYSLKISGGKGAWSTRFALSPGNVYRTSFSYKARNIDPGARIICSLRAKKMDGSMSTVLYFNRAIKSFEGWGNFEVGDFIAMPSLKEMILSLRLEASNKKAEVWFDDIEVVVIDNPNEPDYGYLIYSGDFYSLWAVSGSTKVYKDDAVPYHATLKNKVTITAAKGESEAFQIVIKPRDRSEKLNWQCSDFIGQSVIPKENITCHRVEYITIKKTSGAYGRRGLNPDPLHTQAFGTPFALEASLNHPFWFLVNVPYNTRPGIYKGTLFLSQSGELILSIPLELEVWNFSLPKRPSIDVNAQLWGNDVLRYEHGERLEVLKPYYRTIFSHRARTNGPNAKLPITIQGGYANVNTTEFKKHLSFLSRLTYSKSIQILGLIFISHKGTHRWPVDATWHGIKIFSDSENCFLNPEFEPFFRQATEQILAVIKQHGGYDRCIIKFFDEPAFSDIKTMNALKTMATFLKSIDSNIGVRISALYPHPNLTDLIDEWDIHSDFLEIYAEEVDAAIEKDIKINIYHNSINMIDLPALRMRLFPWMLWIQNYQGALFWSINYWRHNPWEAPENNAGVFLYPPRQSGMKGPVSSIRWEMLLQGLEDYEYLYLLSRYIQSAQASLPKITGDEKLALLEALSEAKDALLKVHEVVERFPHVRPVSDQPYTLDTAKVEEIRIGIAKSIENLITFALLKPASLNLKPKTQMNSE